MKITSHKTIESVPQVTTAQAKRLYDYPHLTIVHMHLQPGQTIPVHTTPGDVAFYVLEGTPTIHIGDEERVCHVDELIDSPRAIPHAITNPSKTAARVLVIKQKV